MASQSAPSTAAYMEISPEIKSAKFDLAISLCLAFWPALTDAVTNQWGGPDSVDKRDWLAGAISDLFVSDDETDDVDVANMLLQVLQDEFDVDVRDDSDMMVARQIIQFKQECDEGNFANINSLYTRWQQKQSRGEQRASVQVVEGEQDTDASEDEDEEGVDGDDVEMDEAPSLVPAPKPKAQLETDEDGFTKVVARKKR